MADIEIYIKIGQELIALGSVAYEKLKALFSGEGGDAVDDEALAKLDALYAARIEQAKKDAGQA